jgi:hypothetical protein
MVSDHKLYMDLYQMRTSWDWAIQNQGTYEIDELLCHFALPYVNIVSTNLEIEFFYRLEASAAAARRINSDEERVILAQLVKWQIVSEDIEKAIAWYREWITKRPELGTIVFELWHVKHGIMYLFGVQDELFSKFMQITIEFWKTIGLSNLEPYISYLEQYRQLDDT